MTTAEKTPDELIAEGQGLVRSIAIKVWRSIPVRVDLEDLIAYGQLGLAEAAKEFDSAFGSRFTTFAYYRIRGAIYDGLSKMTWMSRARYHRIRYQQMANEALEYESRTSGSTGHDSLSREADWLRGVTEKLAVVYLASQREDDEDNQGIQAEDAAEAPPAVIASREINDRLHDLVDDLPADASRLIQTIYFDGATLQEAARKIGISKSWASRLHAKTLEQLARSLRQIGAAD